MLSSSGLSYDAFTRQQTFLQFVSCGLVLLAVCALPQSLKHSLRSASQRVTTVFLFIAERRRGAERGICGPVHLSAASWLIHAAVGVHCLPSSHDPPVCVVNWNAWKCTQAWCCLSLPPPTPPPCLHSVLNLPLLALLSPQSRVNSQGSDRPFYTSSLLKLGNANVLKKNKTPPPLLNQMVSSPMLRLTFSLLSLLIGQSSRRKELIPGEDWSYKTTGLVVVRTLSLYVSSPPTQLHPISIICLTSVWYCWLVLGAVLASIHWWNAWPNSNTQTGMFVIGRVGRWEGGGHQR